MQPKISYLICATPRSGSTLLCEALTNTGVAGKPEQYFFIDRERTIWENVCAELGDDHPRITSLDQLVQLHRQEPSVVEKYLSAFIEQSTTPDGIYGVKIMWPHFAHLADLLKQLPAFKHLSIPDSMEAIFPNLHYIWIRRRDKVREAVSLARAIQTDAWMKRTDESGNGCNEYRSLSGGKPKPTIHNRSKPDFSLEGNGAALAGPYSFRLNPTQVAVSERTSFSFQFIDLMLCKLEAFDRAWDQYFKKHHIEPFVVIYEDFITHYEETALQIVKELGLAAEQITFGPRRLQKQSDEETEEWVARYCSLKTHSFWHRCLSHLDRLAINCLLTCLPSIKLRNTVTKLYLRILYTTKDFLHRLRKS